MSTARPRSTRKELPRDPGLVELVAAQKDVEAKVAGTAVAAAAAATEATEAVAPAAPAAGTAMAPQEMAQQESDTCRMLVSIDGTQQIGCT